MLHRSLAFLAMFGLAACGHDDNDLWGSIDETHSLEFDEVRIATQGRYLEIEYIGAGENVWRMVIDTYGLETGDDLYLEDTEFMQRVSGQLAGLDPPMVTRGSIEFETFVLEAGSRLTGEFEVLFADGETLMGKFDGEIMAS